MQTSELTKWIGKMIPAKNPSSRAYLTPDCVIPLEIGWKMTGRKGYGLQRPIKPSSGKITGVACMRRGAGRWFPAVVPMSHLIAEDFDAHMAERQHQQDLIVTARENLRNKQESDAQRLRDLALVLGGSVTVSQYTSNPALTLTVEEAEALLAKLGGAS